MKKKSYLIIFASNLSRDNTKRKNVKITIKYNVFRDRAVAKILDESYKYFSM